ncbi:hypothetical protein LOAG_11079 [Loa loa]|uniref:Nudix hydrolase domain-containing protein n=1 Tax=Loa loa TaxID=7209 RepID=A0A1I7W5Q1_LOALO|nr:hypothetical protein LOAG_11079 [Loa loa]EFO17418.1 hypothetical protein LOAG_11079 [Loa loa]
MAKNANAGLTSSVAKGIVESLCLGDIDEVWFFRVLEGSSNVMDDVSPCFPIQSPNGPLMDCTEIALMEAFEESRMVVGDP